MNNLRQHQMKKSKESKKSKIIIFFSLLNFEKKKMEHELVNNRKITSRFFQK